MKLKFWGVRGSIATSLRSEEIEEKIKNAIDGYIDSVKDKDYKNSENIDKFIKSLPLSKRGTYGANTSCVEVRLDEQLIILDAGTGLRRFGLSLLTSEFGKGKGNAIILLSHTHFDHIEGWPFFVPVYIPGNNFMIYGPTHLIDPEKKLERIFKQMYYDYFPVHFSHFGADIKFEDLGKCSFDIKDIKISTQPLHHTCATLGYRIEYKNKIFVYETDTEPYKNQFEGQSPEVAELREQQVRQANQEVINLAENADVLVYDSQYTPDEYEPSKFGLKGPDKKNWGHSTYEDAVNVAKGASVKKLVLFHHDPAHNDEFIEKMVERAENYAKKVDFTGEIIAAYEGLEIII